jgi:hypothetical protein
MSLRTVPVTFAQACQFVAAWHRHHGPPVGHKFSLGVADEHDTLVGVAIVGRPVARHLDDGLTLEALRVATDGHKNACSLLYAAAWQAARALGYRRLVTYTQAGENGASLRAAGWRIVAARPPTPGWSRPSRHRDDHGTDHIARLRWQPPDPADTPAAPPSRRSPAAGRMAGRERPRRAAPAGHDPAGDTTARATSHPSTTPGDLTP